MQNADVVTAGLFGIREHGSWHGALSFYTHTASSGNSFGTTFTEKMRLTHDGRLGIGITAPSYKFHVVESAANTPVAIFENTNASFSSEHLFTIRGQGGPTTGSSLFRVQRGSNTAMHVRWDGNVGIGTPSPDEALVVNGKISFNYPDNNSYSGMYRNGIKTEYYNGITSVSSNVIHEFTGASITVMSLTQGGYVGIGTASPTEKLSVDGNILAKKVRVSIDASDWPDYVFENSYQLMGIGELENYIKQNHHLPGVHSAKQIEREGLDLGSMDALLLKKVEELTLYLIQESKEKEELKEENIALKATLDDVLKRLEKLEKD